MGAVYVPTLNRIYFCPFFASGYDEWHYVDCNTGDIVGYPRPGATMGSEGFQGGAYCPELDRVYFAMFGAVTKTEITIIQCLGGPVSPQLMANPLFNKGL